MRPDKTGTMRVIDRVAKQIEKGRIEPEDCSHIDKIQDVVQSSNGCEECLKMGDHWIHLRICLTCGHVGCCDQSKNKHASRHSNEKGHPMIASFEPKEEWIWCFVDEVGFQI